MSEAGDAVGAHVSARWAVWRREIPAIHARISMPLTFR